MSTADTKFKQLYKNTDLQLLLTIFYALVTFSVNLILFGNNDARRRPFVAADILYDVHSINYKATDLTSVLVVYWTKKKTKITNITYVTYSSVTSNNDPV